MKYICCLLSLFLGFYLSVLAGAQAIEKLRVNTDMDCNWKLDGQPMDPLEAHNPKVIPVSRGEHLIQAATTDGVATFRTTINTTIPTKFDVEFGQGKFFVTIMLKSQYDRQLEGQPAETPGKPADADAARNPTWTAPATGLMWTRKDNGSEVDWNQASDYCDKLQLAGYKDWRLPTIEELQGIYDPSVSVKTVFDDRHGMQHVKGNLKLTGEVWSSTPGDAPGKPWQMAWLFNFGMKEPRRANWFYFSFDMRALCVRRSGE